MISTIEYRKIKARGRWTPAELREKLKYEKEPMIKTFQITQEKMGNVLYLDYKNLEAFKDLCIPDDEVANIGDKFIIEVIQMPQEEFENLGEFESFE